MRSTGICRTRSGYGYAASGVVREVGSDVDPNWVGRSVFSFVPHQTSFCATPDSVVALPPETTPAAGSLLPSVETATNIVLDAAPRLGERVVVFGAGVIGLVVTRLLAAFPLESLVVVDPIERRRALAAEFGADRTTTPTELGDADPAGADLAVDGADPRSSCPASRARWTMRSGSSATTRGSSSARGTGPNASRSIWAGDSTGTEPHRHRLQSGVDDQPGTARPLGPRPAHGRGARSARLDPRRRADHPPDPLRARTGGVRELLDSAPDDAVQVILEYE